MALLKGYNKIMFEDIFKFINNTFPYGEFYIVGGATRDFLLKKQDIHDIDIATSLTSAEIKEYLKDANYRFENLGIVNYSLYKYHITFATMRKENDYLDFRHPSKIEFITSPLIDSYRRDFTINAIYFDKNGNIFDPQNGVLDLNNHLIRIIGNPQTRIKEDPLRIIRAYRFKNDLNFEIESTLFKAICDNKIEIQKLSKGKIEEEKHKCKIPFSKDILIFLNI